MPPTVPYGSWPSPVTAAMAAGDAVDLREVQVDTDDVHWLEGRPEQGGRQVVVRAGSAGGPPKDVTPQGANARTRVHEYGGGSYLAAAGTVSYVEFADQRIHRVDATGATRPVTPAPRTPAAVRYADLRAVPGETRRLVAVRETHGEGEPVNDLVLLDPATGDATVLAAGHDFYAAPRPGPHGRRLAWIGWDHPAMPWDATELVVADADGGGAEVVAGGPGESVILPTWSPDGVLHWVSDRTGWWNLYRLGPHGPIPLAPMEAEIGGPQWQLGASAYDFLDDGRIAAVARSGGRDRLIVTGPDGVQPIRTPFTSLRSLRVRDGRVVLVAASPRHPAAVVELDPATGEVDRVLRRSSAVDLDPAWVSVPEPVSFATSGGATAHAQLYRPANPDVTPPPDARPPLLIVAHGGPTGATSTGFDLAVQFWTTRGVAVAAVDYRGSTGYGRGYRRALDGRWGVADVEDCVAAARHLAQAGEADPQRTAIRGGSAGGLTVLSALVSSDVFAAGASYYGVTDLELLAAHTHKFESRYLDSLVGPLPQARATYRQRSPIHRVDDLDTPTIVFQGLEDAIVPPEQAAHLVAALASRGVPHAYLAFEGEQHGFRRADTRRRCLEAELSFYGKVLGFEPADEGLPDVLGARPPGG